MNLPLEKLAPPVALVVIGFFMLVIGATGSVPWITPQLTIQEPFLRYLVFAIGIMLIIVGPFLIWRDQTLSRNFSGTNAEVITTAHGKSDTDNCVSVVISNRNTFPPLEQMIRKAKKEIALYAVQHSYVIHNGLNVLTEKVQMGCEVKILMMAAKKRNGRINPNALESEAHRKFLGLIPQLEANIKKYENWFDSLSEASKKLVQIRTYEHFPVNTLTMIDRNEPDGFIQAEILLFGIDVREMPHYILTKKSGRNIYNAHCASFDELWKKADQIRPKPG